MNWTGPTSVSRLGQVVAVSLDGELMTIDCILDAGGHCRCTLVTLQVRVAADQRVAVLKLVEHWERTGATVAVAMSDGRRGTQVQLSSGTNRLTLDSE